MGWPTLVAFLAIGAAPFVVSCTAALRHGSPPPSNSSLPRGTQALAVAPRRVAAAATQRTGAQSENLDLRVAGSLESLRERFETLQLPLQYAEAVNDADVLALWKELDALGLPTRQLGQAHLLRGRIQLILGNADVALGELRKAIAAGCRLASAQSSLAVALLATGNKSEALTSFEQAVQLAPDIAEYRANLGTALMMHRRVPDAIDQYTLALQLDPENPRTYSDLGTAWLALIRPNDAIPYLRRALALSPDRATFLTNLGYAYQLQGKLQLAENTQRRALKRDPSLTSAWLNLGSALALQKRFVEAKKALLAAQRLDPQDPRPARHLLDLEQMRESSVLESL